MKHLVMVFTLFLALFILCACTAKPAVDVHTDVPPAEATVEATAEATAEAPSDEPAETEEPSAFDEALVLEGVRPIAEAVSETLDLDFDTEAAECYIEEGREYASVSIPASDGGMLVFDPIWREGEGIKLISGSVSLIPPEDPEASTAAAAWLDTFGAEIITVTAEDIAASGCAATEGDKYVEAAYGCFAAKLAAKYMGAEAGNPALCTAADVVSSEADDNGTYTIKLAVIPAEPYAFIYYCDGLCSVCTEGEYIGRLIAVSQCELTQNDDGSFSAPAFGWLGV